MRNFKQEKVLTRILILLVPLLLAHCQVKQLAGAGVETTNGSIAGTLVNKTGSPGSRAIVKLFPADYDPLRDTALVQVDTTDTLGRYSFTNVGSGRYAIVSVQIDDRTMSFANGVVVAADTVLVSADSLRRPGAVKVILPSGLDTNYGYIYIPGTTIYSLLSEHNGYVMLDSVPACVNLSVYYAVRGSAANPPQVIADSVIVLPGDSTTIAYSEWKASKKLFLNTTALNANVAGNVYNFPVLIRLNAGNFNFFQAQGSGNDIRFAKANGAPLSYEIERWDSAGSAAEIWVRVDTVYGNDSTHYVNLYWGNSRAPGTSSGASVFDTSNGFQGVWHLNDPALANIKDATGNHFDGTPSDTAPVSASGAIGICKRFNGKSSYFDIKNTANGKLNFAENAVYTVSAWVYADTLDNQFHLIVGKSDNQYFLKLKQYYPPNPMRWEFAEYHNKVGWDITDYLATARAWKYLVGVRQGVNQYLYLDGNLVTTGTAVFPDSLARYMGDDVTIGRYLSYSILDGGYCPFGGNIDEVRISNVVRNPDWILLCYMNQKTPDGLVEFK